MDCLKLTCVYKCFLFYPKYWNSQQISKWLVQFCQTCACSFMAQTNSTIIIIAWHWVWDSLNTSSANTQMLIIIAFEFWSVWELNAMLYGLIKSKDPDYQKKTKKQKTHIKPINHFPSSLYYNNIQTFNQSISLQWKNHSGAVIIIQKKKKNETNNKQTS